MWYCKQKPHKLLFSLYFNFESIIWTFLSGMSLLCNSNSICGNPVAGATLIFTVGTKHEIGVRKTKY